MDGRVILDNLLAGRTAMGQAIPRPGDHRIAFNTDAATGMALSAALDLSSRILAGMGTPPDQALTAFGRKLVFFARQWGVQQERPSFLTRVGLAAEMACTRAELLSTNIGFATLVDLGRQRQIQREEAQRTPITRDEEIAMMRAKVDPPPPQLFWKSPDGTFALVELVHPFHIWEEGIRLNNCLSRIKPAYLETVIRGSAPAACLDDLPFWRKVKRRDLRLFSLRKAGTILALLGVQTVSLRALALHAQSDPVLCGAFADVCERFSAVFGLFIIDVSHQTPNVRTLLANVELERARRALWPMNTVADMVAAAKRPGGPTSKGAGHPWRPGR